jgi:replicative DNA helicase
MPTESVAVEKAVLGAILLDHDAIYQCGDMKSSDFYLSSNRTIFGAMYELAMTGYPIDMLTVVDSLQKSNKLESVGGAGYVSSLIDGVPDRPSIEHYVKTVLDSSQRRNLVNLCASAIEQCKDSTEKTEDCLSSVVDKILHLAGNDNGKSVHVKDYSYKVYEDVMKIADTPLSELPVGLPTGIPGVDRLTTGVREGEFWVVASWTGEGKSVLATQIIMENARRAVPVLWFTQEMSRKQVLLRMIPSLTDGIVKGRHLRDPRHMTAPQRAEFERTRAIVDSWPLWVNDSASMEITQLYAQAVAMVKRQKVKLIVVDYLQLIRGRGESRYEKVTDVSNMLRELAKNHAPVIAVSQLSKPERGDKRPPRVFDMKESGSIEQDAHVVLMPYRPQDKEGHYSGEDLIIVGKQREGRTGAVKVRFDSLTLTFQPKDDGVDYDNDSMF